ncbi:hypothetical protein GGX14DRAFT_578539 [Mycena pura]|uniref:Zn(2)-C6 fungal-type domain-containing protein n=1 Tax=Mycena pura TaxID=153505 RepID=A0AAD6UTW4_9AGAR|nr:hypothetical protein GGX14DRAFT_578539 [Mycena pura]
MSMTVSSHPHPSLALPPVRLPDLATAGAARPFSAPTVRLPSYKELAAISQCEPEPRASADGPRSSLFTMGLIHLPPLKVPSRPLSGKHLDLARHSHCPPVPHRERERDSSVSTTSASPEAHSQEERDRDRGWDRDSRERERERERAYDTQPRTPHPRHSPSWPPAPSPAPFLAPPRHVHSHSPQHPHPHAHGPVPAHHPHALPFPPPGAAVGSGPSAYLPSATLLPDTAAAPPGSAPKLKFSHAKAGGRTKKQALSCFFCRERKIACGRPEDGSTDRRCNQCARRKIDCTYPTVSHRGQHSRLKSAARKAHHAHGDADMDVDMDMTRGDMDRGVNMDMDMDRGRNAYRFRHGHGHELVA